MEACLLQVIVTQLAVAQAALGGPWTRASFHPLLLTLGGPCGEHGRVNGEGSLSEILVFQAVFCTDPPPGVVGQEPEENDIEIRAHTAITDRAKPLGGNLWGQVEKEDKTHWVSASPTTWYSGGFQAPWQFCKRNQPGAQWLPTMPPSDLLVHEIKALI